VRRDTDHYRGGIEAATIGDTGDRLNWIAQTHERLARALVRATEIINGLPGESRPEYEPSGETGFPSGSGYVQQRGIGGLGG